MNALQVDEPDNEVLNDADQYLRQHKIIELFEDLTTIIAYRQPDSLEGFLVQQIEARMKNGPRAIIYTEAEMQNIFTLYDLKNSGHITKEQCREGKNSSAYIFKTFQFFELTLICIVFIALSTLSNDEMHFTTV